MKHTIKFLMLACVAVTGLWSCSKDENKIYYEGGTAPVLKASSTSAMILTIGNAANTAITFNWTNPDYRFTTGISSQDVTYILQVDTTGANFTNPSIQEVSIPKDLSKTFTVTELNTVLAKLNVAEDKPHNIEFRLKATLGNGSVPLLSNVIKMVITPYLDVVVPIPVTNKLFITGGATPASWMGGGDPELATQKFTQLSNTLYEITIALSAGGSYLFVPQYGDWSNKYGFDGSGNANNVDGDNFKKEGNDIKAPATSGNYKITVNFKTGKFTVVKV